MGSDLLPSINIWEGEGGRLQLSSNKCQGGQENIPSLWKAPPPHKGRRAVPLVAIQKSSLICDHSCNIGISDT